MSYSSPDLSIQVEEVHISPLPVSLSYVGVSHDGHMVKRALIGQRDNGLSEGVCPAGQCAVDSWGREMTSQGVCVRERRRRSRRRTDVRR